MSHFFSRHRLLLVVITLMIHAFSLSNSFVWDDYAVIVYNDFVKSWDNFPLIFSRDYLSSPADIQNLKKGFVGSGEASYRPVVTASYFADYSLWKLNPFGYHLTNLILHVICVLLLYAFATIVLRNQNLSFLAALVFSLHPIQTEAIDNISFREDLLACLFSLAAMILYLRSKEMPGPRRMIFYGTSVFAFLLAVFSKESAIVLPLLLVLFDFYFDHIPGGFWQRLKSSYLGYGGAGLFYLWVWAAVFPSQNELLTFQGQTAFTNFLTMAKVFGIYLFWLFFPVGIHATVPDASLAEFSLFSLKVLGSLIVIVLSLYYAFRARNRFQAASYFIIWFFVALLPIANIIPIQNIMAGRYLYFPMVGFSLLAAFFYGRLADFKVQGVRQGFMKRAAVLLSAGLILVYCAVSVLRTMAWKNNDVFFLDLEKYYPHKAWIHKGLGSYYLQGGKYQQALAEYQLAKECDPADLESYGQSGYIYYLNGAFDKAAQEFSYVLERDPKNRDIRFNLCLTRFMSKDFSSAGECLEKLAELYPADVSAHFNLGVAYWQLHDYQNARIAWEKVLTLQPGHQEALDWLKRLGP